jgi:hypothetical protein
MLREGYLDGADPGAGFDAVWTAGMIYADMAALAGHPGLRDAAADDLAARLAS